jgi:Ca2+-binding RTX toxin-like protein
VRSANDVNGDGFDDLIVGADSDDPNGSSSGASFVVFGGNFTGAATQVGTTVADTLLGSANDDVIFAGIGDDTLIGNGGNDRLSGGQGDDVFVFDNLGGTTTIIDFEDGLGGQDVLDLTAFGFADGAAVLALASASGPGGHDVLLQLDADDSALLENVGLASLDATDFLL